MGDALLAWVHPSAPLRLLRTLVGLVALARLVTLVPQLRAAADPATADPLVWGGLVNAWTWPLIAALWGLAALALVVGRRTALAAGTLAMLVLALLGADAGLRWSHLYVLGLVCVVLAAGARSFEGPAWSNLHEVAVPGWPVVVARLQVSIVYLFAGVAKVNEDFLSGLVLFEHFHGGLLTTWLPAWAVGSQPFLTTLAVAVIAAEWWLATALWVTRWFKANVALAVVLHAGMVLLAQHGEQALHFALFAVLMWSLLLVFHSPLRRCGAQDHPPVGSAGFEPAASRV